MCQKHFIPFMAFSVYRFTQLVVHGMFFFLTKRCGTFDIQRIGQWTGNTKAVGNSLWYRDPWVSFLPILTASTKHKVLHFSCLCKVFMAIDTYFVTCNCRDPYDATDSKEKSELYKERNQTQTTLVVLFLKRWHQIPDIKWSETKPLMSSFFEKI